jgi:TRAP-type mannitol/chloroaromatic compound transport system substrate-binding protein
MAERKILGVNLEFDERVQLAQLTNHPGWRILVKVMAEACRNATEEVIRLNPTSERYPQNLEKLQMTARAMSKFSNDVLESVREHLNATVQSANAAPVEHAGRFKGFGPPKPPTGEQQ